MSVLGGWVLAPAVLAVVACGLGLGTERAAGVRLPGAAVPGAGLAALIALAGLTTRWDATAELTLPLVAGLAVLGIVLTRPWADPRLRAARWPLLVAAGAYAVYALPSIATGQGSLPGYISLDDSATWIAHVDQAFTAGRDLSGLPPSSYRRTLEVWMGSGYPIGAFLPLGVASALGGQDPVGAYGGVIALYAVVCALGIYACARPLARTRAAAATAALVAVQASLLLGYAQWGGIKEVATAALLTSLAAIAAAGRGRPRVLVVVAVGAGALTGMLGLNVLAWGGPLLLAAALVAVRRADRATLVTAGAALAALAVAAIPALSTLDFLRQTTNPQGGLANEEDLGNLIEPLSVLQGLGLWPSGDFRLDTDPVALGAVLSVMVLAVAAGSVTFAVQRRHWAPVIALAVTLTGAGAALQVGSAWVDAKALAVLSPVALGTAAAGVAALGAPWRHAGLALLALLAGWSTLLAARDIRVAPRERMAELRDVAERVGPTGPALQLDFDIYGDRHFLRAAAPEGATDLRVRPVARTDGSLFPEQTTAEVDEIATPDLWAYRTIVRRRSPVASRPPTGFDRLVAGEHWEAWTRPSEAAPPVQRLPLGDALNPVEAPDCASVRALAELPGVTALAAVPRRAPVVIDLGPLVPVADLEQPVEVDVPTAGTWRVWVGGSVRGRLEVAVDGRVVGTHRHELAHAGQWLRFGTAELAAGSHTVTLRYARGSWRPGRGRAEDQSPLGPLALTPIEAERELEAIRVAPDDHRRLCDGRTYDWVEALG